MSTNSMIIKHVPYKTVKLGKVLISSKGKKPQSFSSEYSEGLLPYIDIKAFEQDVFDVYTDGEKCLPCEEGDILIVWDGSRSGMVGKAHKGFVGSTLAKINVPGVINQFLYYFLQGKYQLLNTKVKGTGTPHVNPEVLGNFDFPIVEEKEQERIVAKIEELFSELDKGIEVLLKTKSQLKVYKQAVLRNAFEGKLTTNYRCSNSIKKEGVLKDYNGICFRNSKYKDASGDDTQFVLNIPKEWLFVRIGDVFNVEVGSTPSRRITEYWNGDINWVSSGEVKFNNIISTNECITPLGLDKSSTKLQPIGTVLLAMIGEGKTRGQAAILMITAAHNQNTAAILVSQTPCSPQYIYYYLMLNYEYTRRIGSGNNQKALNKERVRALNFPFTSFDEQVQIVSEIESRLSVCDKIEQTVDKSLLKAESLRQSILKKAFAGGLVHKGK